MHGNFGNLYEVFLEKATSNKSFQVYAHIYISFILLGTLHSHIAKKMSLLFNLVRRDLSLISHILFGNPVVDKNMARDLACVIIV